MKDYLLDLVSHTYDLGCIDLVKIVGDDTKTAIAALSEDRSVIVEGQFAAPVEEFVGTFGMPNLNKLKILLNLPEYKENATLVISRRDSGLPDGINFSNASRDFQNHYRFMSAELINEKLKTIKFKGATWSVEFEPTINSIQRLKMQSQANAEEPTFQVQTDGGDLKFFFGDHSTHAGNFVFQNHVGGQIKRRWSWPVAVVSNILALTGDKIMRISDEAGVMMITVDSTIAVYNYLLPAHTK